MPPATGLRKCAASSTISARLPTIPGGQAALQKWLDQKNDLLASRTPWSTSDGLTVAELVNRFLTHKKSLVESSELRPRTWEDYYTVCKRVVSVFGRNRLVSDLVADDFAALRTSFAKTRGPYALAGDITRVRVLFK